MAGTYRGSRRGVWHGRDGDGSELAVQTAVSIGAAGYRAEVATIEDDPEPIVIETTDRRIVHHHHKIERAIRAKAYQHRPIRSFWKPEPQREPEPLAPLGMTPCPVCRELGEIAVDCGLCDGEGLVTERRLAEWRGHDA